MPRRWPPAGLPTAWRDLTRSFALRTALGIAAVVLGVSVLGFSWGYLRAQAALREQLDYAVASEAESFVTDFEMFGPLVLLQSVRAQAERRSGSYVLLQTVTGQVVAGALPGAPVGLRGFADIRSPSGQQLRAVGAVLPGGLNLIVAADTAPVGRTAAALTGTLPLAGGLAALSALGLGWVAARRLERRLRLVSEAAREVMAGDLSRRLPATGSHDEFDRLVATINGMLGRIEALVEGLKQVTVDVAHDLRGPLSRLRQRLEGALARARDPAADEAALEAAIAELDGVLGTFAALLRIARAEAGLRGQGFAPVDLSALAAQVAEVFEAVAEEDGKSLLAGIAPGVTVEGDAALLRQMLANLVENALSHGGDGVRVTVSVRRDADGGAVLSVGDNGPGIPAEEREKVLRRFYRLDRSRTTPGTGLGLALAAAAAKLHGAALRLEEAPGGGLSVVVAFPPRG
ncbi:HAMP domain-containing histidine kinase [Roseomonas sp. NAR14]|uniref:histidine kinase n=1 Tax=Roseomonas acroporae TaxID=2937791 RepID=A0A9X1YB55_9PROT|nr:ATP-binding protein [Roseomonas acroporae]MCK8786218.1 HAMP domain-containing histidine kinase [Roseomonas acroporae]